MYPNLTHDCQPLRYERHIVLPKLLAQHAEGYELGNTMYNQDHNKAGTARRYLCSILKEHVNCYSIEVSMYGYNKKGIPGVMPYTEEGCILHDHINYSHCHTNIKFPLKLKLLYEYQN